MTATPLDRVSAPPSLRATRFDVYGTIHKAIRHGLAGVLSRLGATSFFDEAATTRALGEIEGLLTLCERHIEHEDGFIRPALIQRGPLAVEKIDAEHLDHARLVAEVRSLAEAVKASTGELRPRMGRALYLHFSAFVAETLAHMAEEERVVQPLLERLFTDAELSAIQARILGSIPPGEMAATLELMIPAVAPEERAAIFADARGTAPPEAFSQLLGLAKDVLSEGDFADLTRRLSPQ